MARRPGVPDLRMACPECERGDTLSELVSVPGWRQITVLRPESDAYDAEVEVGVQREVDWFNAEREFPGIHCSGCDGEYRLEDLVPEPRIECMRCGFHGYRREHDPRCKGQFLKLGPPSVHEGQGSMVGG